MTTSDDIVTEENPNFKEWVITPEKKGVEDIDFYDSLRRLLLPYQPVDNEADSDVQYSTNELIQAIEVHYAIPQGDKESAGIDGEKLVEYMITLGYECKNTGGLQLQWLMRKRQPL